MIATSMSAILFLALHKASSCRVGIVSVNEVTNGLKDGFGDCNGGWSTTEIALVSRCIIGA